MITLQMVQQLKPKNINVVPRQIFCHQFKAKVTSLKLLLEKDSLH